MITCPIHLPERFSILASHRPFLLKMRNHKYWTIIAPIDLTMIQQEITVDTEKRRSDRNTPHEVQKGTLYLCADHRHFSVDNVDDFSPNGVGLTVCGLINSGDKVLLRLQHNRSFTPILGYVMWSSSIGMRSTGTIQMPVSRLGIRLIH
ncbi:hypothetical protein MMIC_P2187 [Mariprofundus micogutta]|uniref:PilZ domain-containing protein n=1 Tax=Mariprofundus micogutta TaxID=1921010 RepID=A0A1L8CQN8_9PROT|nr:hypothetical protein MMIC_P2187 [Mariprofundus micogutta]